ncbi:hypothetical protein FHX08_001859 [Rhizobium sp. BK529]|uniref:hypothetical protein n=1 Tax=unclassified Rhizobium TaxID=2613769 RepID=UPI00104F1A0C|nr:MULTISPECIES: hypothetical protein [unclassified Rhizobium]MBB3591515.1 hypothetical protein [Rhizobium sp. BK529]TCS08536.1 hypothetical protein EV281_101402 [Rhizobium sp. BK418]
MACWGKFRTAAALGLIGCVFPHVPAGAEPAYVSVVHDYVETLIRPMVGAPVVVKAIEEQNAKFRDVSEMDMLVLDETYRAEVAQGDLQMVKALMAKPISHYLKSKQDDSQGTILEFFVTDCHGLNVGQSIVTTDYWQGDEDKFLKTFAVGSRDIYISQAERNESTQRLETQASFVVTDERGEPIGTATVTIAIDAL